MKNGYLLNPNKIDLRGKQNMTKSGKNDGQTCPCCFQHAARFFNNLVAFAIVFAGFFESIFLLRWLKMEMRARAGNLEIMATATDILPPFSEASSIKKWTKSLGDCIINLNKEVQRKNLKFPNFKLFLIQFSYNSSLEEGQGTNSFDFVEKLTKVFWIIQKLKRYYGLTVQWNWAST